MKFSELSEKDQRVVELDFKGFSQSEIARTLKVSRQAINERVLRLKNQGWMFHSLKGPIDKKSWSEEELLITQERFFAGASIQEVAKELNRTESSVKHKRAFLVSKYGVDLPRRDYDYWTTTRVKVLSRKFRSRETLQMDRKSAQQEDCFCSVPIS